ncbi:hypothetical protein NAEGRDRAFT_79720 [Naegleria gruberi]|uniref:Uncharacterized protein n=1 Tax=Naegleria gruberi TaxID=5762 RepID=D2VF90_NAEGR|nr:uncharacterized protein NAEGRDRAFT_79720 [Naegleria gruberi]EFC44327.1 hypothetical protein NAEGRDRAFT_79720 [Naegleria gruberi]|eukprot:XP_002677071.1 hypothetical protein NAEGRDRAFT_79720 [Naegleria gruberi strain NEG-M]
MGRLVTPKRKIAATGVLFIISIIVSIVCLGVGAYFAKSYWDFIHDAFHSTEKPLLTESTQCTVLNDKENCRIEEGKTVDGVKMDVKYCHLAVSYSYNGQVHHNTTLDDFAKYYRISNQSSDWIELKADQYGFTVYSTNSTVACYASKEYPDWFVGIAERTLFYYYTNIQSFLTSSSIIAVVTLIPAALCIIFVMIPAFICLIYQCRRIRKLLPENLVGEQHFKHQAMGGHEDEISDEEDDHHTKRNKNYF